MLQDTELWLPVDGFPNAEVSNLGRVRSLFRGGCVVRSLHINGNGYVTVSLQNKSVRRRSRVHRLVAAAFIGPAPAKMDVNHLDGNKQNNRADNLEYCTRSENHKHAFRLGLSTSPFRRRGEQSCRALLNDSSVMQIRERFASGESRKSLAAAFNVSACTIWDVVKRRSWTHI